MHAKTKQTLQNKHTIPRIAIGPRFSVFTVSSMMLAICAVFNSTAHAQSAGAPDEASSQQLDTVTVRGNRDLEARFMSTGSRVTIGRRDIEAMGANTIGDVLRQTPGLQVTTTPNGGLEIRMRGMGPTNTRILIDGVPASTSNRSAQLPLDELPADLIERIEVLRAPTAERQGAAGGTLNLVLRATSTKRETTLWMTNQHVWGKNALAFTATQTGPLGAVGAAETPKLAGGLSAVNPEAARWSYFVSLATTSPNLGANTLRDTSNTATPPASYSGQDESRLRNRNWTLIPRLTGRLGNADRLILRGVFAGTEQPGVVVSQGNGNTGTSAYSSTVQSPWKFERSFAQLGADWSHSFKDSKWDTTVQLERARNDYSTSRASSTTLLPSAIVSNTTSAYSDDRLEHAQYLSSKLTAAQGENLWSGGIELDRRKLDVDSSTTNTLSLVSLQNQASIITRSAVWGQLDIPFESIKTTTTLGLRAQDFKLNADINAVQAANFQNLFWQPSINARTALSDTVQMRWNLARITRNPRIYELLNTVSPNLSTNGPTSPDFHGNPNLKPQTTVTLDFGLEKRLAGLGQTGINVFLREQRDVLARRVYLASNGRWEEQPDNVGSATVWGIETDVRTNLVWAGLGPDWSLSANASVLQSKMRDGPAAGERIPGQARYLANVNLAKPLKVTGGWYGGTSVAFHGSSDQAGSTAAYHAAGRQKAHAQLDVFIGSVIPNIGFWRLNVYNITDYKQNRQRTVTDANGVSYSESTVRRLTPRVFLTFGTRF